MQVNEQTLVISQENRNKPDRWDFQSKIENALIMLDSKTPNKLHSVHLQFEDYLGVTHDYYLEIMNETPEGSDRNYSN